MKEALREGSLSKLLCCKAVWLCTPYPEGKEKKSLLEKEGISLCKETKTQNYSL